MTKSQAFAIVLIVMGIVTLALGSLLPVLLPTSAFWSVEQAQEQGIAASRLHQVTHRAAHTQVSTTASESDKLQAQQELESAQARYDASRQALDRAQFWNHKLPAGLHWGGAAVALLGVLVYYSATSMRD